MKWQNRNVSDENTEGSGDEAKNKRNTPLATGDGGDPEGDTTATNEHDENLIANFYKSLIVSDTLEQKGRKHTDEGVHDEIPIPDNALEDIELVVESSAVDRVEDLGKDEGIEHESSRSWGQGSGR